MGLKRLTGLAIPPQAGMSVPLGTHTLGILRPTRPCAVSSAGEVFRLLEEEGVSLVELEPVPLDGL